MNVTKKWLKRILITLSVISAFFLLLIHILVYTEHYGPLPSSGDIENIQNMQASEIKDVNNFLIGKIYIQDRSSVEYKDISSNIITTLVAIEDKRFYEHSGVDYISLMRVIVKSILLQNESSGGGSTLTQQLAKNLYPRLDAGILFYPINKIREMIIARRLEKRYDKKEIITLYLNTVSFGMDIYGVESASQRFFSKNAIDITPDEAAILVGMLKASTYYNPLLNPENSKARRDLILNTMAKEELISQAKADSLTQLPLNIKASEDQSKHAPYFQHQIKMKAQNILKELFPDKDIDLAKDGYQIHTTLDLSLQKKAEEALINHMKSLQSSFIKQLPQNFWNKKKAIIDSEAKNIPKEQLDAPPKNVSLFSYDGLNEATINTIDSIKYYLSFLRTGFMAADPTTGGIRTWIGGIDYDYFPYDHILSERQVGSTIKPFIYASALEQNLSPCEYFQTVATSYEYKDETWTPKNSDSMREQRITMQVALEKSVNTVSVQVLKEAGIKNTIELLRTAGINADIPEVPSIALGTPSISLYEMIEAYSIFVNEGRRTPLFMIEKITDRNGAILYMHQQETPVQVISTENANIMRYFLQNVVNGGTGASLRSTYRLKNDLGGKTGTSQNGADGWFISISPKLITGTWVGGAYPDIRFQGGAIAQGAKMALPIPGKLYQSI
ncbi:MAG: transglycosylase domain-containing protein, partial [Cyclobacteriaceae bacterium]|nr:transglycosylase domain-containing protein [Cyclobacteriaceae bacterium]